MKETVEFFFDKMRERFGRSRFFVGALARKTGGSARPFVAALAEGCENRLTIS